MLKQPKQSHGDADVHLTSSDWDLTGNLKGTMDIDLLNPDAAEEMQFPKGEGSNHQNSDGFWVLGPLAL